MKWYNSISTFLNCAIPNIRATRKVNLALLTCSILSRRQLSLSVLARELARSSLTRTSSHHHNKKRLFRFLSNHRLDPFQTQTAMMPHIVSTARLKGLTPIMIDWSDLGRGFNGLFAAVCFRKRGLPLLSWVSRSEELNPSQNRLEEMFIRRLVTHLPNTVRPLILADRGFGRASLLLFIQRLPSFSGYPVDYVIRLKKDVIVQSEEFRCRLRDYPLRKRRIVFVPGVKYRQDGAVTTNLVLFWGSGHKNPWYLATSLSDARLAVKMYRKRMQPEQYFRDGKQRFSLASTTVTTSSRLQRLLLGVVLACVVLILVGMRVSPSFRKQVCSWGKFGVLHLGLEYYFAYYEPPPYYLGITPFQTGYV